jgi:hypothetical protein
MSAPINEGKLSNQPPAAPGSSPLGEAKHADHEVVEWLEREWEASEAEARQRRALTDRIYFLEAAPKASSVQFRVLGTTERAYTIDFFKSRRARNDSGAWSWSCSCRDFGIRRRPCKHVHFVWYRVLGVQPDPNSATPFFDSVEAVRERLDAHAPLPRQEQPSARPTNAALTPAVAVVSVAQRAYVGESCPICYETMDAGCETFFCCGERGCGNSVHRSCYQACVNFTRQTTCPYCRANMRPPGLALPESKRRKRRIPF